MTEPSLKDRTARGLLWSFLQNGAMQLLNVVFGIVLGRLLSRSEYGLVGEVTIFSSIAAALQESGFIAALINRKNATREDYNSVFWFNFGVSVILYIVLWFCAPLIANYFHQPELLWLSRYIFLGFVLASLGVAARARLYKELRMKQLSILSVVGLALSGIVGITMALLGCSYWSLATQSLVFVASTSLMCLWAARFRPTFSFSFRPIREMFGFSCKLLLTNIFNCVNNSIFALVFGRIYTSVEVGTYSQADKWNKMGSQLITGMVQGVAQPTFVQVGDDQGRLQRAFRKMLRFTAFISFPAMFGLAFIAPQLIPLLLGDKWLPSAHLMQLLCVAGAVLPIATLYYQLLISRGRSTTYMWNILAQGILILLLLFCVKTFAWELKFPDEMGHFCKISPSALTFSGIRLMVLSYVLVTIGWLFVWHYFLWREIRLPLRHALKDIPPFALLAALAIAAAYFVTLPVSNRLALMLLRIVLTAAFYLLALWLLHANILRESLSYLLHRKP